MLISNSTVSARQGKELLCHNITLSYEEFILTLSHLGTVNALDTHGAARTTQSLVSFRAKLSSLSVTTGGTLLTEKQMVLKGITSNGFPSGRTYRKDTSDL